VLAIMPGNAPPMTLAGSLLEMPTWTLSVTEIVLGDRFSPEGWLCIVLTGLLIRSRWIFLEKLTQSAFQEKSALN
jgi:hypothetical protein